MRLVDFCAANDLAADRFSMELWKQSGEMMQEWARYAEQHGDSAASWDNFCRQEWEALMQHEANDDD
jgi:hypothetical protein